MTGGSVAGAAVAVLIFAPAEGYTVEEIVTILRGHGFPPNKAYYDAVYGGLVSRLRAGEVARTRDPNRPDPWRYTLSESMRELIHAARGEEQ